MMEVRADLKILTGLIGFAGAGSPQEMTWMEKSVPQGLGWLLTTLCLVIEENGYR